jgi:hypothetical protein
MEDYSELKELANNGKTAALSTMYNSDATKGKDYPYTSLVPYTLDKQGRAIIYVSDLAMHTKNLRKNNKCSLMVSKEKKDDIFNSARITFIGTMKKVPDDEVEEVKKLYLEKYPDAKELVDFYDFSFYRMEVEHIHYIGGFGDINWYQKDQIKKIWE